MLSTPARVRRRPAPLADPTARRCAQPLHHVLQAVVDAQDATPAVELRESNDMAVAMELLTSVATHEAPPSATPARPDAVALEFARHGCGPVSTLPFGLDVPLAPAFGGNDGDGAAQILDIHSLIDAAVAIRTPRTCRSAFVGSIRALRSRPRAPLAPARSAPNGPSIRLWPRSCDADRVPYARAATPFP